MTTQVSTARTSDSPAPAQSPTLTPSDAARTSFQVSVAQSSTRASSPLIVSPPTTSPDGGSESFTVTIPKERAQSAIAWKFVTEDKTERRGALGNLRQSPCGLVGDMSNKGSFDHVKRTVNKDGSVTCTFTFNKGVTGGAVVVGGEALKFSATAPAPTIPVKKEPTAVMNDTESVEIAPGVRARLKDGRIHATISTTEEQSQGKVEWSFVQKGTSMSPGSASLQGLDQTVRVGGAAHNVALNIREGRFKNTDTFGRNGNFLNVDGSENMESITIQITDSKGCKTTYKVSKDTILGKARESSASSTGGAASGGAAIAPTGLTVPTATGLDPDLTDVTVSPSDLR
jgi:hypothetical protein